MSLDIDLYAMRRTRVFDGNYTHNIGRMAKEIGIYDCLWRAPENGYLLANQLIAPLTAGLEFMRANAEDLKNFNPENGWGSYDSFLVFVENILEACIANPDAEIETSR